MLCSKASAVRHHGLDHNLFNMDSLQFPMLMTGFEAGMTGYAIYGSADHMVYFGGHPEICRDGSGTNHAPHCSDYWLRDAIAAQ